MVEIRFYNELGEVRMGKGAWRLTAAEGLSVPCRKISTACYSKDSGPEITDTALSERAVTLSGDIFDISQGEYSHALEVLYKAGTLEINAFGKRRRTEAVCTEFLPGERKGKYRIFTVQFLCSCPYFESAEEKEIPLFKVTPAISSEFVFPGVFSHRISRRTIMYQGNVPTEPIFHIAAGDNPVGKLSIMNHTSGESLSFDYSPLAGEFITVDVKNRKIYSSDGVNLLKYLSDDSFFDGFHLMPGSNDVEVVIGEMNRGLSVTCSYSDTYLEAVV